jgi:hypothetical protein
MEIRFSDVPRITQVWSNHEPRDNRQSASTLKNTIPARQFFCASTHAPGAPSVVAFHTVAACDSFRLVALSSSSAEPGAILSTHDLSHHHHHHRDITYTTTYSSAAAADLPLSARPLPRARTRAL